MLNLLHLWNKINNDISKATDITLVLDSFITLEFKNISVTDKTVIIIIIIKYSIVSFTALQ